MLRCRLCVRVCVFSFHLLSISCVSIPSNCPSDVISTGLSSCIHLYPFQPLHDMRHTILPPAPHDLHSHYSLLVYDTFSRFRTNDLLTLCSAAPMIQAFLRYSELIRVRSFLLCVRVSVLCVKSVQKQMCVCAFWFMLCCSSSFSSAFLVRRIEGRYASSQERGRVCLECTFRIFNPA